MASKKFVPIALVFSFLGAAICLATINNPKQNDEFCENVAQVAVAGQVNYANTVVLINIR